MLAAEAQVKTNETASPVAQAKADIGAVEAKARFVRTPTFQPTKMLRHAPMAASTGRIAAF